MRGGARPGAGRKPGGREKPHISAYWSDKQIKDFFQSMYERQQNDARIAVWCGDQLSGKAAQAISLSDPDGSPLFSSLKELSDGELERLAAGGEGGASQARTRTA
jgi:hypothetical protein